MKILDLYCCEGGAARGYQQAGWEVTGVDMEKRFSKRYAGDRFIHASALEVLADTAFLKQFDAVHASPPCQAYSITKHGHDVKHPMLIEPTRELLQASGLPYVIENVVGAPLENPTMLCWSMFYEAGSVIDDDGTPLRMERHRLFETNWDLTAPREEHHDKAIQVAGAYGGARRDKWEAKHIRKGGYVPTKHIQEKLLGIDWMTQYGLYQSLPPVYTKWIGHQLSLHIMTEAVRIHTKAGQ